MTREETEQPEIVPTDVAYGAMVRGEIDIQIQTAQAFPRKVRTFKERVMEMATLDPETAEKCYYSVPRGGDDIIGPSVRLAEIVAGVWGNMRVASRVVGIDDKHVTCQAACHDLENNLAVSVEVKRRITNKYGKRYNDDMVATTANAGCAIAFRNAVFKVVPAAMTKDVFAKVLEFVKGDDKTHAARRKAAVEYFTMRGIGQDRVLYFVGRSKVSEITGDDLLKLRGVINAIGDGDTTLEEAFAVATPEPEKLKEGRQRVPLDKKGGTSNGGATGRKKGRKPKGAQTGTATAPPAEEEKPAETEAPSAEQPDPDFALTPRMIHTLEEAARDAWLEVPGELNEWLKEMHGVETAKDIPSRAAYDNMLAKLKEMGEKKAGQEG